MTPLDKLREYAFGRAQDVARGAETPHLAGLLVQKYGYGLCDACACLSLPPEESLSYQDVDQAVAQIDPDWQAHAKERWSFRPAQVSEVKESSVSLDEIQWQNIRQVVRTLADWGFGGPDDPKWGSAWLAMVTGLTAKDGPEFKLTPLISPDKPQ